MYVNFNCKKTTLYTQFWSQNPQENKKIQRWYYLVLTIECKKKPQKATQGKKKTHMGERRRRRRSSKEIKETLTSKQKENPMGSLVFCTQHKGIYYCNDERNNLKTTLSYLEIHRSAIHPPSNKKSVVASRNMYLTQQHFSLKLYT